jgi:Zn-dependent metalloprotease
MSNCNYHSRWSVIFLVLNALIPAWAMGGSDAMPKPGGIRLIPLASAPLSVKAQIPSPQTNAPSASANAGTSAIAAKLRQLLANPASAQANAASVRAGGQARTVVRSGVASPLPNDPAVLNNKKGPARMTGAFAARSASSSPSPNAGENRLEMHLNPVGTPRSLRGKIETAEPSPRSPAAANPGKQAQAVKKLERTPLQAADANRKAGDARDRETVNAFLDNYRDYLRLASPQNELKLDRNHKDSLGRAHYRFSQTYRGLPVWPAELIVHLDAQGDVDAMNGSYIPTPLNVATEPVVSVNAAQDIAKRHIPSGAQGQIKDSRLILYGSGDVPAHLAWKLELEIGLGAYWIVVVDALNGDVMTAYNTVQEVAATGSGVDLFGQAQSLNLWFANDGFYYLIDTSKPMYDPSSSPPQPNATRGAIMVFDMRNQLNAKPLPPAYYIASSSPNAAWLPDGVSAEINLSHVYDYYRDRHGRDSIDGQGGTIIANVRLGSMYRNAFWTNEFNAMYFGDAKPYAGALDIVAHEMTHGVTSKTARLIYKDESGAMNEAFSDIFGEMVEAYVAGRPDWLNGTAFPEPSRSLKDPGAIEFALGHPYPSKLSQYVDGSALLPLFGNDDHGGVHINSSIFNHAYYLVAEGLNGGIGLRDAERIFYRALTEHLTQSARFLDGRLACIQAAEELFGVDSAQAQKVAQAFDAVEIFDSNAPPAPTPAPSTPTADAAVFVAFDALANHYRLAKMEAALGDGSFGEWLSPPQTAVANRRPAVSGDGELAIYVTQGNDICTIPTNSATGLDEECFGFDNIYSVALSRDGSHLAIILLDLQGNPSTEIVDINLNTNETHTFSLVTPVSEGSSINAVLQADAMDYTLNDRYLVYDALNRLTIGDGSDIQVWSIYAIDLQSGATLTLLPPIPGLNIGNPATGKTSANFLSFELIDQITGFSTIYAANLETGDLGIVGEVNDDNILAAPSFSGDDATLVYTGPDATTVTRSSLFRQSLANDRLSPQGGPVLWVSDGAYGAVYRRGSFQTLSVVKAGLGTGLVVSDVEGIYCGDACSASYLEGVRVTLMATADFDSGFSGWSGACIGTNACRVTLDQAQTVVANFSKQETLNRPPIANAGADQSVKTGVAASLNGAASGDPDNGPLPLSYVWTQTAGPAVTLANPTSARPAFTPTQTGSYTFSLTVSDGQDNSPPDTVTITVTNAGGGTGSGAAAKVFLDAGETFPIEDKAVAQVYGGSGFETLALHGAPNLVVDQNVERVEFPGGLNSYSFQAQGNQVVVKQNGVTIAAVAAQDDGDGTRLAFADGAADLKIVGLGAMTLGGKSFGANPASFAPAELGAGFDASDKAGK